MAINIGLPAIDRTAHLGGYWTYIEQNNAANESGTIVRVEIWAHEALTEMRVGIFYLVSGTTYKCRDSAFIGDVAAGSKQVFSGLSLAVQAGDLIGLYFEEGSIDYDPTGHAGQWEVEGDHAHTNDEATYDDVGGAGSSLFGTSEAAGVTHELAGIIAGIASVSGLAAVIKTLAGITSGIASVSGLAFVAYRLSGTAQGAAGVTGLARITRALAGISPGAATATASLATLIVLSGAITGTAIVTGLLFPVKLVTRILHIRHPALMKVVHKRGEAVINEYDDLSSLDGEYLTKQVGLDVVEGDLIWATTVAGVLYPYLVK
ncbi:hypothetical protein ES705_32942 [subsurface metagenome]